MRKPSIDVLGMMALHVVSFPMGFTDYLGMLRVLRQAHSRALIYSPPNDAQVALEGSSPLFRGRYGCALRTWKGLAHVRVHV